MSKVLEDIKNIVRQEIELLNDKVSGIILLESLKFNLIPKFSDLEKDIAALEISENHSVSEFEKNNHTIHLSFSFNKATKSKFNKEVLKDTLFIVLKGGMTLDFIEKNKENNQKISIYPLMGICLSPQTIINLNSLKNTFFIELINFYSNSNIENLEKDVI